MEVRFDFTPSRLEKYLVLITSGDPMNMRVGLIFLALAIAGCANTEFRAYDAKSNLYEGRGGTFKMVDGLEIWDSAPARKFKVLGVIFDDRPGAVIPMAMQDGDMVKEGRRRQGDALIRMGSNSTLVGVYTSGQASATVYGNSAYANASSNSVPLRRNAANFAVIKYVE